jgi:DNA-binding response OmpR family regulator
MFESFAGFQDDQKARLLIVDDEQNIRLSLVRALSMMGYCVEEASSGHEALALVGQKPYDLMMLDIRMPGMDGTEVMHRVRELQPDLLIIILTGYPTLENAITAVKLEAVDYVRKPASTSEITNAVNQALRKHAWQLRQRHMKIVLSQALDALNTIEAIPVELSTAKTSSSLPKPQLKTPAKQIISVFPLKLDCRKRLVTVNDDPEQLIQLTKGEMAVLAGMMSHPNQVLSCQQLVHAAWGYEVNETEAESVIRPYISRLRRKFKHNHVTAQLIHTIRRRGYCFAAPLEPF